MFKRFPLKIAAFLASLLFLAAPEAFSVVETNPVTRNGLVEYKLKFTSADVAGTISIPIRACHNMTVFWERSNATVVSAYSADSDDDTEAEIEANTPALDQFTATEKADITPTKAYVRFVVDTVTSGSVPSTAVVVCSEYAHEGAGGSGLANVVEDTSPTLGGDLDAGQYSIDGIKVLQGNHFYSEEYLPTATSATWEGATSAQRLTAINDALTACASWATTNRTKGTVWLPKGRTVIVASGSNTSPLISLPEIVQQTTSSYNAACDLVGHGAVKDYAGGGTVGGSPTPDNVGSSLVVWYPDNMVAANGYKAIIYAPGHGQVLKNFNVVMTGDVDGDVDGTTMLLAASSTAGGRTFGANGVKYDTFDHITLTSARVGYGTGFASLFWLDNSLTNSWIAGLASGWLLVSGTNMTNNSNWIAGNRFKSNVVAIDIPGGYSCQDLVVHGGTIEANAYGIRLRAGSTCDVVTMGVHWEQDYTAAAPHAGVNDVLIDDVSPTFASFGDTWDSVFNAVAATSALDHIERTALSSASNPPDMVVGGTFRNDEDIIYTYPSGGRINVNENYAAGVLGLPKGTTLPTTCEVGNAFMDTDASAGSRLYLCESANTWVAVADGIGGGGSDVPITVGGSPLNGPTAIAFASASPGLNIVGTEAGATDSAEISFDYSVGYGSTSTVEEIVFSSQGTGSGGFRGEGQTANAFEYLWSIPLMSEATADAEHFFVMETIAQTLTNKTLASPVFSGTASGADTIPSSLITTELRSMWFGAAGLSVDGTHCVTPAEVTINSGPKLYTTICADNDAASIYGSTTMPDGWDGGTVTFEHVYLQTAADTGPLNGDIAAQCRGNGEVPSSTWGTEVAIDDAAVVGSNSNDHTTSAAVTPAGTCAAGDTLYWRYQLDATGTTTAVATLHTLGFKMEYTSNVGD